MDYLFSPWRKYKALNDRKHTTAHVCTHKNHEISITASPPHQRWGSAYTDSYLFQRIDDSQDAYSQPWWAIVVCMPEHAESIIVELPSKIWDTCQQRSWSKHGNINRLQNLEILHSPCPSNTASKTGETPDELVSRTRTELRDQVVWWELHGLLPIPWYWEHSHVSF